MKQITSLDLFLDNESSPNSLIGYRISTNPRHSVDSMKIPFFLADAIVAKEISQNLEPYITQFVDSSSNLIEPHFHSTSYYEFHQIFTIGYIKPEFVSVCFDYDERV